MAPFEFLEAGFCTECWCASFCLLCAGRFLDHWSNLWSPGSTCWPGDLFEQNMGSPKTHFYYEIDFSWGFRGFHLTQMNCMVPRTHLGVLLCPKPWFLNHVQGISRFSGKPGNAPGAFPVYLLFPFVDLIFPLNSRSTRVAGHYL